jgi:hypothetical protein
VRGSFVPPDPPAQPSDRYRTAKIEKWLLARAVGRAQLGRKSERQIETAAQSAGGPWATRCDRKIVFSLKFLLKITDLIVLFSFFLANFK